MVYSKAELKKYEAAKAAVERSVYLQQLIEQSDKRRRKRRCLWVQFRALCLSILQLAEG
ncbi:MAG: hypothetical protein M3299_05840 [Thermoproteota archaeon]|nr:hypothetical protein [Thermoproteota archaeon]